MRLGYGLLSALVISGMVASAGFVGPAVGDPRNVEELRSDLAVVAGRRLEQGVDTNASINGLAQSCLLAVALAPSFGEPARKKALAIAHTIIDRADENGDGVVGWGVNRDADGASCAGPGTRKGLTWGRTTCNPVGTEYTYQTGLAVTCLARTFLVTGDTRSLEFAKRAADQSWRYGSTDTPCSGCFTYWPSYSPNDEGRFIRNMNVAMGMGMAWLFKATGDARYADRARAISASEHFEVGHDNRGYLGVADPQYRARPAAESTRTENHLPLVAKGLRDIGTVLRSRDTIADAVRVMDQWIECDDRRCREAECRNWAGDLSRCTTHHTLYSCWLKDESATALGHCTRAAARIGSWTDLALWLVFEP